MLGKEGVNATITRKIKKKKNKKTKKKFNRLRFYFQNTVMFYKSINGKYIEYILIFL